MRLVTFQGDTAQRVGALVEDGILDLGLAGHLLKHPLPTTMQGLIDAGPSTWSVAGEVVAQRPDQAVRSKVPLLAPLPCPPRLRDASLFLEHMEVGLKKLGKPMSPEFYHQVIYYNTNHTRIFGPGDDVPWPSRSSWIDYELEWACVIGRAGSSIARDVAREHIFGFTIFNDWSARDLQFPFMEGGLGPALGKDFANSLGPCIVTLDELADPYALRMSARINGELWSDGSTSTMHHHFEDAIHHLSRDYPLLPGEICGSGTVLNGCGFELDRKLSIGDIVELEVEGIGVLRNRLVAG